jgi:hypothetical protein
VFSNMLALRRVLVAVPAEVRKVVVDFSEARLVDHTTLQRIHRIADEWPDAVLELRGLDQHTKVAEADTAVHVRRAAGAE